MSFTDGPYVQAACFCEQVIEGKDGTLSLIRIVDILWHNEVGPNPPAQMPNFPFQLKLVLMFKSGRAEGRSEVKIVPSLPNGETETAVVQTVHFEGDEKGQNLIVQFAYVFRYEGLYWFNVLVDEEKITAIPLRVRYQRVVASMPPQSPQV